MLLQVQFVIFTAFFLSLEGVPAAFWAQSVQIGLIIIISLSLVVWTQSLNVLNLVLLMIGAHLTQSLVLVLRLVAYLLQIQGGPPSSYC